MTFVEVFQIDGGAIVGESEFKGRGQTRALERVRWIFSVETDFASRILLRHRATRWERRASLRHAWTVARMWEGVRHHRAPQADRPIVPNAVEAAVVNATCRMIVVGDPW